jgi:ATP-dependent RNA helicase RhlE
MKNTIHLSSETTITYHYKPERDELTVQFRQATGAVHSESLSEWEHVQLQREQPSGEVVGFTINSVQQVLLEQLVRSLTTGLQPHFAAAPRPLESEEVVPAEAESAATPDPIAVEPSVIEAWVPAGEAGETHVWDMEHTETTTPESEGEPAEVIPVEVAPEPEDAPPAKKSRSRKRSKAKKEAQPEAIAELEAILTFEKAESEKPKAETTNGDSVPDPFLGDGGVATPKSDEMGVELIELVAKADTPTEEAPEVVAEEPAPAPKKSRSRKRKTGSGTQNAETTGGDNVPLVSGTEAVAMTDGDLPSNSLQTEEAETVVAEAVVEAPTDENPPADPPQEEGAGDDPSLATPQEGDSEEAVAEVVAEPTPKAPSKSRSRRRKKSDAVAETVTPEAEAVQTTFAEISSEAEAAPSEAEPIAEDVDGSEGDDEGEAATGSESDSTMAVVGEPGKRKRRKRRKRRNGNTGNGGEVAAVAEPTPSDAPASGPTRHSHYATTIPTHAPAKVESESSPVFRSAYKSAPIEGLDAPDEFLFMGLDPLIGQALHAMGYESPTAIQRRAVPDAMAKRDIVGLAQTGTGKTMAFLLPSFHRMLQNPIQGHRPRLLVLTPTRELALQVATEAEYLATHTDFVIAAIYGQEDMKRQIRILRDGVDVVVATPGRLLDHLQRGTIRLNTVETVVLDEADRMLDMGFLPDVRKILNRVPGDRQTMMYSATMPQAVQSLSLDFQRDPVLIEVARQLPPSQIDQKLYPVERHLKIPLLEHLMKQDLGMRSVMIFTETKSEADIVHRKLTELGFDPAIMHGDISQRERERALEQLRGGKVRMLVATNVAARGLDIQDVTHVINYEVPQTVDDYVHRIGRTARGEGSEGTAMTFTSSGDDGMIKRIESALERTLPRVYAEGFNYDVPTPSWAKPSADDITESLTKPKNLAERFKHMMRRR